jgi:hypothetical protein
MLNAVLRHDLHPPGTCPTARIWQPIMSKGGKPKIAKSILKLVEPYDTPEIFRSRPTRVRRAAAPFLSRLPQWPGKDRENSPYDVLPCPPVLI